MPGGRTRRAWGSRTTLDVLLRWAWIRRRGPEDDLRDLEAGVTLKCVGFTKSLGGSVVGSVGKGHTIATVRAGWLMIALGQEPVWHDRRGSRTAVLRGPVALVGEGERVPVLRQFAAFDVTTADGTFDLRVTKRDAPVIRHAFSTVPPSGS